jgi:UDP-N-acetylmuramate dehydrogenase
VIAPERGVSLAPHTSLRVGGAAEFFVQAHSADEFQAGLQWARSHEVPVRVIGGGSNLLVSDAGVDGLVIRAASTRWAVDELVLRADAGVTIANLARRLAKQGLGGLEWAANVPGTVGGACVNNAGAFGGDTASCLLSASVVDADGRSLLLRTDELRYAYRTSELKRRALGDVAVAQVEFRLQPSTPAHADGLVKEFNAQRMRSQPRISSAGSVFANPSGDYSGRLIEACGLKGVAVGGAQISEQHANFIVNRGSATALDVFALMARTQRVVFDGTGVWLRPEIELFGRWSADEHAMIHVDQAVTHG